jgi:DNA-binding IclR family transcriptional regulator
MNPRQRKIIQLIGVGGHNSTSLAREVGAPEPSIRRSIQTLRSNGWNISFADPTTGVYSLLQTPAAAASAQGDGDHGSAFDTDIDAGDNDDFGNDLRGN